jgi:hypothetical protein
LFVEKISFVEFLCDGVGLDLEEANLIIRCHGLLLQLASIQPTSGINIWRLASSLGQPFHFDPLRPPVCG